MHTVSHLLTGEELSSTDILNLIEKANVIRKEKAFYQSTLKNKQLALLFDKPSLRTRFSFTKAVRDLGGDVIESLSQTRKNEWPEDQIRVLQSYCDAIVIRTHDDETLNRMQAVSTIPIINGLSNLYHPCQILADLQTLHEEFGNLEGLKLAYVGDGNNILHNLLLMAPKMGVQVHYATPKNRGPENFILHKCLNSADNKNYIFKFDSAIDAVMGVNAIYTDVWSSMGFEETKNDSLFSDFQINEQLMSYANDKAIFMHCLPMERGKEVSMTLPDLPCSRIFKQAANRLHMQKALLLYLLTEKNDGT